MASQAKDGSSSSSTSIPVTAATVNDLLTPRVTIQFCTQCKWMLRAAYFAQELLSTFSTALGEVALIPSTGGVFVVTLEVVAGDAAQEGTASSDVKITKKTIWDRKVDGGFPETKELKKRVRDIIDPSRNLGHVDGKKGTNSNNAEAANTAASSALGENPSHDVQVVLSERKAEQEKAEAEKKIYECEDCK